MAPVYRYAEIFVGRKPDPTNFPNFNPQYVRWTPEEIKIWNTIAFMTPNGRDAAFEKRLETLKNWCRYDLNYTRYQNSAHELDFWRTEPSYREDGYMKFLEGRYDVYDNKPLPGFLFYGYTERYTTDNKMVQIMDPRGFVLEIPVYNVLELLSACTVVKGVIHDELVWARRGSTNLLVAVDTEAFMELKDKK
jgi:hypothetical protein